MQIDNNFVLTESASTAAAAAGMQTFSFKEQGQTPQLMAGDLLKFGDADTTPIFFVINRLFIWKSPDHLVVQYLLDLAPAP